MPYELEFDELMLGIYEFRAAEGDEPTGSYPKEFVIDYVRGYLPAESAGTGGRGVV